MGKLIGIAAAAFLVLANVSLAAPAHHKHSHHHSHHHRAHHTAAH